MEEKNLTDEVIKAVSYLAEMGEGRGYIDGYKCKVIKFADILDLIHRLQEQVNEYERKIADGELVSKDWHDEQVLHDKAEIERLTEENGQLKGYNNGLEYETAELQKQVDALKDRLRENLEHLKQGEELIESIKGMVMQAVKDTAKEIYELAVKHYNEDELGFFEELKERYGVEVE